MCPCGGSGVFGIPALPDQGEWRREMKKRMFVIDGHALCYRAHYAFINNPLTNSKGQNVSAIFGFARMLLKLVRDENPDYLIVAFDPPEKTFRFRLFPEYKANREKMPDDLRGQIEEIKQMISVLGIQIMIEDDYEADDVLGTLASKYAADDLEVMLVTSDKDAYQLVDENVKIYANKKGISEFEVYDRQGIIDKIGLKPEYIKDYMALTGDSSDNIPGIRGVGPKTALKLIDEYKTLENLYSHVDEIKGDKLKQSIIQEKENAFLSRELVTIKTDLPVKADLKKAALPDLKRDEVKEYFSELEMNSIIQDIFGDESPSGKKKKKEPKRDYRIINSEGELKKALEIVRDKGEMSIDTETTSVNPIDAALVGISFSIKEGEGWYLPVKGSSMFDEWGIERERAVKIIRPCLEDPAIKKIGQNIKYDMLVLMGEGINMKGIYFDTLLAAYLLNTAEGRYNLDVLASKYLDYKTTTYQELTGIGKKAVPITEVPLEKLAEYAIEDADITYRLYKIFRKKLKEEKMERLFYDLEMPLVSVLALMEWNGVKIDIPYFSELLKENQKLLKKAEDGIFDMAGQKFNINSTKELSCILFEKLGLKPVRKTKTGYSTDIRVLEALKGHHDIIGNLILYRTYSKLKNTYIEALPKLASEKSGRIHTSYNQTVVATGRLSSSSPNLQNIPIRDDFGKKIRKAFIAEEGCVLISADYSQIELRLAAHLSGDASMVKAFTEGIDIHNLTASSVFGVSMDEVTAEMRRQAKIINFSTIYGVSPFGLSQQADLTVHQAAEFIKKYFETYPGFKDYVDRTLEFARKHGYVETIMGRRRPVPDLDSGVSFRREGAERIAINTPIQGASADLIKIAMVNIQRLIHEKRLKTKMILQVHDELVFESPHAEADGVEGLVRDEMEGAMKLSVPLVVDIARGANWDEAH